MKFASENTECGGEPAPKTPLRIVRLDPVAVAECRRELAAALLTVVARVRGMYPTNESVAACDEAAARLEPMLGAQHEDELQLELRFERPRRRRKEAA